MPIHHDPAAIERVKYDDIWSVPDYQRASSPGVANVERFLAIFRAASGSLIDIGCGQGRAGLMLAEHSLEVTWFDITGSALLPAVPRERFICAPVWKLSGFWDFAFCVDMMEHVPTEYVMLAIDRIVRSCRMAFLSIALRPDVFGQSIGQPLHLTVREFTWWRDRIGSIARLHDARDLCGDGLYICSKSG